MKRRDQEQIPECIEVRLAYDLSAIPLVGVILFYIAYGVVWLKMGEATVDNSYWIRKGFVRLWTHSIRPIIILATMFGFFVCSSFSFLWE